MGTYKIKESQTALDVVNQLFVSLDNIDTLYLENISFDVNKMQDNLELTYEDPSATQDINDIKNNRYIFINRDNIVYNFFDTQYVPIGVHTINSIYSGCIYEIVNTGEKGFVGTNTSIRIFEATNINIYKETF